MFFRRIDGPEGSIIRVVLESWERPFVNIQNEPLVAASLVGILEGPCVI
jgi:hypothetical protein